MSIKEWIGRSWPTNFLADDDQFIFRLTPAKKIFCRYQLKNESVDIRQFIFRSMSIDKFFGRCWPTFGRLIFRLTSNTKFLCQCQSKNESVSVRRFVFWPKSIDNFLDRHWSVHFSIDVGHEFFVDVSYRMNQLAGDSFFDRCRSTIFSADLDWFIFS